MLVIGHRGAKALAKENTIESFNAGLYSGALILEFDVHITKNSTPIVIHDSTLRRTHKVKGRVKKLTLKEIRNLTDTKYHIPSLEEVLDKYWGKIYLNIEIKGKGAGEATVNLLKKKYIKKPKDWENCFISSFSIRELKSIKKIEPEVNLAILHNRNPFAFIAYARQLNLVAVGFHRLYANPLAVEIAKKSGLFTYAYTVNRPKAALILAERNIDAVITDDPGKIINELEENNLLG